MQIVQLLQFRQILADHLVGALPLVEQSSYNAQSFDLIGRIEPFTQSVTQRLRETVPPLPDSQGVFTDAGIAFDIGNAHGRFKG